ncbi:19511_t:CDS:2, partial [Racocetra fulgida]
DLLTKNYTWLKFPCKNGDYILFGGENNLQVLNADKLTNKISETSNLNSTAFIQHGFEIASEEITLTPSETQTLLINYTKLQNQVYQERRKVKRAKTTNVIIRWNNRLKQLQAKINKSKNKELLEQWLNQAKKTTNIGSTILINTD